MPKRRWSFAPKFSFLRRKKTGAAAIIAQRAEAAQAGAEAFQTRSLSASTSGWETPLNNPDLEALWQTLHPSPVGKGDVTDV